MNILAYYPGDWVLVESAAPPTLGRVRQHGGRLTATITTPAPRLCPRSVWESPRAREEWLRTGKIPAGTPELRRIASVRDAPEAEAGKEPKEKEAAKQ